MNPAMLPNPLSAAATGTPTGNRYYVNPQTAARDPQEGSAALTRAQYRYFLNEAAPTEQQALRTLQDPKLGSRVATLVERDVKNIYKQEAGLEQRAVSQFGIRTTGDQNTIRKRRMLQGRALAIAGGRNLAQAATEEFQLTGGTDAMQIGRGIAGQASRDLAGAAANAAQVENANDAQRAQNRQNMMSTVLGFGGIGAALGGAGALTALGISGATAGAGAGASIGLLAAFV